MSVAPEARSQHGFPLFIASISALSSVTRKYSYHTAPANRQRTSSPARGLPSEVRNSNFGSPALS